MTLLIAAALAATSATQPAPAVVPPVQAQHAQHGKQAQPGTKPKGDGCCCKNMAEGGTMACCAEHGEDHGGEHAEHGAKR